MVIDHNNKQDLHFYLKMMAFNDPSNHNHSSTSSGRFSRSKVLPVISVYSLRTFSVSFSKWEVGSKVSEM